MNVYIRYAEKNLLTQFYELFNSETIHIASKDKPTSCIVLKCIVDVFQLVIFLPSLCRKMGVPYCIVKSKARLGRLVRRKTCTCVALTQVNILFLLFCYYV